MFNRRKHPRARISIGVQYKALDLFETNTILNISKGGMFIKTNKPHPLGTVLSLEFTLPGRKESIHATGLVVWNHKPTQTSISSYAPGMGVKLTKIEPGDLALIEDYVFVELALAKSQDEA